MAKPAPRRERVPAERGQTLRLRIADLLGGPPCSARDISLAVRISEKEVSGHLEHLQRSLPHRGLVLEVTPAECARCGFAFVKRGRLSKPGRCPVCRGESVHEPLFAVRPRDRRDTGSP